MKAGAPPPQSLPPRLAGERHRRRSMKAGAPPPQSLRPGGTFAAGNAPLNEGGGAAPAIAA